MKVTLNRHFDRARMVTQLCAYFDALGLIDADPADVEDEFLNDPNVALYAIHADGRQVGFSVIETYPDFTQVCEFHVDKALHRQGIGTRAAHLTFALAPGPWELNAMPGAEAFWRHAIATCDAAQDTSEGPPDLPHQVLKFRFTWVRPL